MATLTGIDKILLTTPDFQVDKVNSTLFGLDTSTPQGGNEAELPYLLTDKAGREVKARKIYHNSPNHIGNYTIRQDGLLVQFNPSKISHPYLLAEVGSPQYKGAIAKVLQEMDSIGIHADLEGMKLIRVDLAKQAEMSMPCSQYEAAFKLMKGKRNKTKGYEGGYLFHNTQNECMFYDKREEMKYLKVDQNLKGEQNFMRAEVRMLKHKSTASILKVATLNELNTLHPEHVTECYNRYIKGRIFSKAMEGEQMTLEYYAEVEIVKYFRETSGKRGQGWKEYLLCTDIDQHMIKIGGIEGFGKILHDAGYGKSQVYDIMRQVREMLNKKAQVDRLRNEVTTSTLIDELREQFAA